LTELGRGITGKAKASSLQILREQHSPNVWYRWRRMVLLTRKA